MPTREKILLEQTFKQEGFELPRRVFYALTDTHGKTDLTNARIARAVGFLIETLHEKGLLNEREIDNILIDAAMA